MDLVETIADLDNNTDLHVARLLMLIAAFSANNGVVEGITKLAKLDFFLRYPVMLEKALTKRGRSTSSMDIQEYERLSVESQMVRYRFGPWDHRYRQFLNVLIAKKLITVNVEGRTVVISLTDTGRLHASRLCAQADFKPYVQRAALLKRHFDLQATNLMKFIYREFPEVVSLRSNQAISP